jgi:uncharacterized membrane protein HdeD (DUF308 family)
MEDQMITNLFRNWWLYTLRGALAVLFGVLALLWPGQALTVLVTLFGAFVLADGLFTTLIGFSSSAFNDRWWALLLEGVAGIAVGLLTLFWPGITAQVLVYFIAAWAIIIGILEIVAAIHFRRVVREWMLLLSGLLSMIFGVLLFVFPSSGEVALVWTLALFAIVHGVFLIVDSLRFRDLWKEIQATTEKIDQNTDQLLNWWMRY